ncbi:MAG TPA: S9 family peptidase [Vicinamibacterales bacterium]|nr:S9 family peptidase [Vicinamibacterales bacterium]
MRHGIAAFVLIALLTPAGLAQQARPLTPDDIFAFKNVSDPQISPDGAWVAYTVSHLDQERDASDTDIYMVPLAGGEPVRLTTSDKPETRPRWSPNDRYLAFLSSRDGEKTQVWLLDRRGGEATVLTDLKGGVSSFEWSPDSTRLALIASDPDPEAGEREKTKEAAPKPIVVTRLQFKRDGAGFLNDLRSHVYVFDVAKKTSTQLTRGQYDDSNAVWSPDGNAIAFVSNRTAEPDSNFNTDIFIVPADGSGEPRRATSSEAAESSPVFTRDGASIVHTVGGNPKDIWYATNDIAVTPAGGGAPRVLTASLDRNVSGLRLSADGSAVMFLLEDRGNTHLARVPLAGGAVERVVTGERDIAQFDVGSGGAIAVLESTFQRPNEISIAGAGGSLTRLTRTNDQFLAGIQLGKTERFEAKSADGTIVDAFLTRPPQSPDGTRLPTLLRIHGGPVSQYSTGFNQEWQMLAAAGYAVVGANPRGSSGRGRDFSYGIWADWGNKDFEDVMAAVDHVIAMGVADPNRLGVGGWSYGGILTNYVITKTTRFKGAISGASEVNYPANYGHDHYQRQWEAELGLPWENVEHWIRISPFYGVGRVKTPTLILCGQEDWNVPLQNSEQLYQALRRLGVPTELVVYPGQGHSIRRPSYQKDRYQRYIAWYDKYVKGTVSTSTVQRASS